MHFLFDNKPWTLSFSTHLRGFGSNINPPPPPKLRPRVVIDYFKWQFTAGFKVKSRLNSHLLALVNNRTAFLSHTSPINNAVLLFSLLLSHHTGQQRSLFKWQNNQQACLFVCFFGFMNRNKRVREVNECNVSGTQRQLCGTERSCRIGTQNNLEHKTQTIVCLASTQMIQRQEVIR